MNEKLLTPEQVAERLHAVPTLVVCELAVEISEDALTLLRDINSLRQAQVVLREPPYGDRPFVRHRASLPQPYATFKAARPCETITVIGSPRPTCPIQP